jgi:Flp pilus assembly pilin Flp
MAARIKSALETAKKHARAIWKDESAQGATEYILLLVVVVSIGLMFRRQITAAVQGRLGNITESMNSFNVEGG